MCVIVQSCFTFAWFRFGNSLGYVICILYLVVFLFMILQMNKIIILSRGCLSGMLRLSLRWFHFLKFEYRLTKFIYYKRCTLYFKSTHPWAFENVVNNCNTIFNIKCFQYIFSSKIKLFTFCSCQFWFKSNCKYNWLYLV